MEQTTELLWRVMPGVRRRERGRFTFFFVLAVLLGMAEVVGLAGSEALFLSRMGAEQLPRAFIAASVATFAGSLLYAAVVGRTRNDRLFIALLCGTALTLIVDLVALQRGSSVALTVVFCTSYLGLAVFMSLHYVTFAADFFDALSSKRLFPLLGVGASVGGVLGGTLSATVSQLVSGEALIGVWAAALLMAALHVRMARANLLRWTPVGASESDESSFEGLRAAMRYVRRSRMFAWLALSVVGMVVSLTLMQYLYLDIFSKAFPSPEELATFFGIYLAITNGIEILVGNALTPWLIRRFGVAQANLAHPVLTLLTFAALAIQPSVVVAVGARANRELLENALARPVRALSYNALPRRFYGRMRALLDGVVFYSAMSIAGVLLLTIGGTLETHWLAMLGGAFALLYASANLIVRREYMANLVEGIRSGRLDLHDLAGDLDPRELEALAQMWAKSLDNEREPIALALLQLAEPLARHGFAEAVRAHRRHPDPRARLACLEALAACRDDELTGQLADALSDDAPTIRRRACQLIAELETVDRGLRSQLRARLGDEDIVVRSRAAALLGGEGHGVLRDMLESGKPASMVAALNELPAVLVPEVLPLVENETPDIRAGLVQCLTRLGVLSALPPERLVDDLRHDDPGVRRAAAAALASRRDDTAIHALAQALDDLSRTVRMEAQTALSSLGNAGVHAAAPYTKGSRVWTVDAALCTIAAAEGSVAAVVLRQCYDDRVREAWSIRLAIAQSGERDDVDARFLRAALQNAYVRACGLAMRVLELSEDGAVVRSIRREIDLENSRMRGEALEVLSNLGDRSVSQLFSLLLEDEPIEEKLPALSGQLRAPTSLEDVLESAAQSQDRWLRLAAARYGRGAPPTAKEREIMERLLALQSVPLFTHLSLEQLEIINRLLQEVQYMSGEVIVREGDPGDELFVLMEGEVEFIKAFQTPAQERLAAMQPVGYFGEIAVLDDEPRSLTVRASQDARLLTLAGARFKELILQAPEIAFEVFPVLIRRIRAAEEKLTQLRQGG